MFHSTDLLCFVRHAEPSDIKVRVTPSFKEAAISETVTFFCNVSDESVSPSARVRWIRLDSKSIAPPKYSVSNDSYSLTITDVQPADSGVFECSYQSDHVAGVAYTILSLCKC